MTADSDYADRFQTASARAVEHLTDGAMTWVARRVPMASEIGDAAQKALVLVHGALDEGKSREAKELATTMAILIDKAQLLAGGPTSRSELPTPADLLEQARLRRDRMNGPHVQGSRPLNRAEVSASAESLRLLLAKIDAGELDAGSSAVSYCEVPSPP